MKTANVVVQAGVCGFVTQARAEADDDLTVRFSIESGCDKVRAFGADLVEAGPVDALEEISRGNEGTVLSTAARHCKGCCAACVAPDGIFKAMQVAAGLALPVDARIELRNG